MSVIEHAIDFSLHKNGYSELKPNQRTVIEHYMKGKDVLFCAPTGSGKSLIFEMAPFLFQSLENKDSECTCIVVPPLSALMKSQVQKLLDKNIKALYLKEPEQETKESQKTSSAIVENLEKGLYELVFTSPETLLQMHRNMLMTLSKKKYLKAIFVDEAHCIKKFGKANTATKQPAYRPCYGSLGELRSLAGPDVPVVALTATASKEVRETILKDLSMNENVFQLTVDPNKQNIKYWVFETTRFRGDISKDFDWLVDLLRIEKEKTPRMIIFFRKIDHIADVFEHLETSLGEQCYVNYSKNGTNDDRNRLFDMYHLKTDDEVKDSIACSYQKEDGNVRVVLCFTSFSMGLDVKGVDTVIHYGACNDLDDYLQESGRAGRQHHEKCHAIVMKYKQCLSSKNITPQMKHFIKTDSCRRNVLLKPFTEEESVSILKHNCCDNCASSCVCLCSCVSPEDCTCDILCAKNESRIYARMQLFQQEESDTESEDQFSEGYDSDSDIDEHRTNKPHILEFTSDED